MDGKNDKGTRTPTVKQRGENSHSNGIYGRLGEIQIDGQRCRIIPFRNGRDDSEWSIFSAHPTGQNAGGILSKLIEATKFQATYHRSQLSELENQLAVLEEIATSLSESTEEQES